MNDREILKQVIRGGFARPGRLSVFTVCNGVRCFEGEEPMDCSIDLTIEIHCTDRKQLELQV